MTCKDRVAKKYAVKSDRFIFKGVCGILRRKTTKNTSQRTFQNRYDSRNIFLIDKAYIKLSKEALQN